MSNFLELCLRRQSCRSFSDQPVEHDKLAQCVEAGRLAPSGCNAQPWSFVVAETPAVVAEVAKCGQQMNMNPFLSKAQAFIIVLEEHAVLAPAIRKLLDSQYFAKGDLGAATVQICLEAAEQGLGTCIIGVYDREKICELLDIPVTKQFGALIAVGYPADGKIRPKIRKSTDEVLRFV
ncbi:MAG: nitroreductase family protein [Deltaproteobacteria bacterium]|nr:nitroreductase family protein [Deltaproteobacteria bacterium]